MYLFCALLQIRQLLLGILGNSSDMCQPDVDTWRRALQIQPHRLRLLLQSEGAHTAGPAPRIRFDHPDIDPSVVDIEGDVDIGCEGRELVGGADADPCSNRIGYE